MEGAGSFLFRFRRIEPQKLRYEVVSFPEGVEKKNSDAPRERQRCDAAEEKGWRLAAKQDSFLIFYTDAPTAAPVVESATQKQEDTHRLLKQSCKNMTIFCGIYLINFLLLLLRFFDEPLKYLLDSSSLLLTTVYILFFTMTAGQWLAFWRWSRKARLVLKEKQKFLEYRPARLLSWGCAGGILASILIILAYIGMGQEFLSYITILGCIVISIPLTELLCLLLMPARFSEKWRGVIVCIVTIVLLVGIQIPLFILADELPEGGYEKRIVGTYDDGFGHTLDLHDDELPLVMADFYAGDTSQYGRTLHMAENSPFLSFLRAEERYHGKEACPAMLYELYTVRLSCLYDDCLALYANGSPGDPSPWGAEEVYVWQVNDEHYDFVTYLVLWEDKILFLSWSNADPLTTEQIAIIANKLNPTE